MILFYVFDMKQRIFLSILSLFATLTAPFRSTVSAEENAPKHAHQSLWDLTAQSMRDNPVPLSTYKGQVCPRGQHRIALWLHLSV